MPLRPPTHEQLKRKARGEPERKRYAEYDRLYARDRDPRIQRLRSSHRWHLTRSRKLAQDPLCQQCERDGRATPATQVHHVVPVSQDLARFFDPDNLESICETCHARANARERRP